MFAATPRIESPAMRSNSRRGGSARAPCASSANNDNDDAPKTMREAPTASGVYTPPAKASLPKTGNSAKNTCTAESAACAANSPRPSRAAVPPSAIPDCCDDNVSSAPPPSKRSRCRARTRKGNTRFSFYCHICRLKFVEKLVCRVDGRNNSNNVNNISNSINNQFSAKSTSNNIIPNRPNFHRNLFSGSIPFSSG